MILCVIHTRIPYDFHVLYVTVFKLSTQIARMMYLHLIKLIHMTPMKASLI